MTVLRPPSVLWKGPREVRVHQAELSSGEIEWYDGVPVTSAMRTAWDLALWEPLGTAVAALDAMVRSGSVGMRRAVPLVDRRAESAPESRVRVAQRRRSA